LFGGKEPSKVPTKAATAGAKQNKPRKPRTTFTIEQKIFILDEIKKGLSSQERIIAKHNTNRGSVARWKRDRSILEKQLKEELRGNKKRVFSNDPLKRIKHGIRMFYDLNDSMPKALKIPITRKYTYVFCVCIQTNANFLTFSTFLPEAVISAKALNIKNRLMEEHGKSPFLTA
jgi:hypothetical protein